MAEWVRNLPAMKETQGQEDPLEKETATHNNIFAWEIPWREESGRLQSKGSQKLNMTEWLGMHNVHCNTIFNSQVMEEPSHF